MGKKPKKPEDLSVKQFIKAAEDTYGEGVIAKVGDIKKELIKEKEPTGVFALDFQLNGGFTQSSIVLLWGDPSSGKTLSTLYLSAQLTKQKKTVLFIDAENRFNIEFAEQFGIDFDYFYIARPDVYEKVIDLVDGAVRTNSFALVVVDSTTAGVPEDERDKSAFDAVVAKNARLNSSMCKKVASALQPKNQKDKETYNKTIVVFIAQIRQEIGKMYGDPSVIPGGKALKFYSSTTIRTRCKDYIKKGDDIIGREIFFKVTKASESTPYVSGTYDFYVEPPHIDNNKSIVILGVHMGIIQRKGAWYHYGQNQYQGKEALIEALTADEKTLQEIKEQIINAKKGVQNKEN